MWCTVVMWCWAMWWDVSDVTVMWWVQMGGREGGWRGGVRDLVSVKLDWNCWREPLEVQIRRLAPTLHSRQPRQINSIFSLQVIQSSINHSRVKKRYVFHGEILCFVNLIFIYLKKSLLQLCWCYEIISLDWNIHVDVMHWISGHIIRPLFGIRPNIQLGLFE